MFAALFAVARNAELFALGAPTDDIHLFIFTHQAANFLTWTTAAAMVAETFMGPSPAGQAQENRGSEKDWKTVIALHEYSLKSLFERPLP
jgi:hypothetical protein